MASWEISRSWSGVRLPRCAHARIELARVDTQILRVRSDAPYYGDASPDGPPGATEGLWNFEVVELFLADAADNYLEIELGPAGHHLVISLRGVRRPVQSQLPITYQVAVQAPQHPLAAACDHGLHPEHAVPIGRVHGEAFLPFHYLPKSVCRANAYAIHGAATSRCYHAHACLPDVAPDFHRLECFAALPDAGLAALDPSA